MEQDGQQKYLPAVQMLREALGYWLENSRAMWLFTAGQVLFAAVFVLIGGWTQEWFLLWAAAYYVFWYGFFRYVFNREPYVLSWRIVATLIPSIKIVFMVFLFLLVLMFLPYVPYLMGDVSLEVKDNYTAFLQQYMQDSQAIDLVLNVVFTLFSPLLFMRPVLAWIGAIIGRSWSILSAFSRTQNNYFPMLLLMIIFNAVFGVMLFLIRLDWEFVWPIVVLSAPVIVFFSIVMGRVYSFFWGVS